jgi:phosphate transport system permease protein
VNTQGKVIALGNDQFLLWQLGTAAMREQVAYGRLVGLAGDVSHISWGPGYETLLVVDAASNLHRFDPRGTALRRLGPARAIGFDVTWLGSEIRRRVVYLLGAAGELLIAVPGSGEELFRETVDPLAGAGRYGVNPEGKYLHRLTPGQFRRVTLHNPFPETGWRSLWMPQWFGAYEKPGYSWHPDGPAIGVPSKLSLSPLLYGTFKAAFYGILMAIPLALGAAVYTGYFLPPRIRNRVKPTIEMLEAFPTVVLGFIAGLWLAPLLLDYLVPIMLLPLVLIAVPLVLALGHLGLQLLSPTFKRRPPRVALVLLGYLGAFLLLALNAEGLEQWLFAGSFREWLWLEFRISYEQRNALLVGMAMGIAITPTMFSIVEDAIFAVPRSLSDGSLALGATRWQSLARVVLPAASPAILSALLIGLARGLGETMIVLLATGNTPLMEASAFSGLRSLSASIAAELPEAASTGVQFRLLFLAALVLFGLTFVLNTVAELFRQRLRYAYASR